MGDFSGVSEAKRLTYRLAAEAGVDWRTVQKWLGGRRVAGVVALALERATERLSLAEEVARVRGVAA
jgi:hypothetical protein